MSDVDPDRNKGGSERGTYYACKNCGHLALMHRNDVCLMTLSIKGDRCSCREYCHGVVRPTPSVSKEPSDG